LKDINQLPNNLKEFMLTQARCSKNQSKLIAILLARTLFWNWVILILFEVTGCGIAYAGPPFFTDDPEPVPYRNWEVYLFSTFDISHAVSGIQGPALEINAGALPNLQIHFSIPCANITSPSSQSTSGLGDAELGAKYRFVEEAERRPQLGIFPIIVVPTGHSNRGLGNGRVWARLPFWVQKSWGPWTSYGGVGYALNPAPGMRNFVYGGWLLQRDVKKWLTLGGELFTHGADSVGARTSSVANVGGIYKVNSHFNLLFTLGHSLTGERRTVAYTGLYWTWGPHSNP
jgi:hypothetical protein